MRLRDLFEAPRTAVIAFGRMNPPTIGHAKLVDKIKSINGDHYVFLSQSQKPKTDPLAFQDKLRYAKFFFPEITIGHPEVRTIIDALKKVNELGYTNLVYVAGSDRVPAFEELINKYNGQEYNFKSIQVVSAGERDPDADGAEGMSASKMRAAAAANDLESFKQGVPRPEVADEMFAAVRQGMGIKDTVPAEGLKEANYGRYWCSTDKKWKQRKGPKQKRESIEAFLNKLSEAASKADADALTQAVRDFQTKAGITVDGKVGPETRRAMQAAIANTGETPPSTTGGQTDPADVTAPAQAAPAQQPAAQPTQTPAQAAPAQAAPAQAAPAQQPAAQPTGPDDGTRGSSTSTNTVTTTTSGGGATTRRSDGSVTRQEPATPNGTVTTTSTGGSGPGGAYTAADINNGNMPTGLSREMVANIQAAARTQQNPNAVVYNPNDQQDF